MIILSIFIFLNCLKRFFSFEEVLGDYVPDTCISQARCTSKKREPEKKPDKKKADNSKGKKEGNEKEKGEKKKEDKKKV